jgi:hypothetical protein
MPLSSSTKVGRQMSKLRCQPGWPPRVNQVADDESHFFQQKPGRKAWLPLNYFCTQPAWSKPMDGGLGPNQPLDISFLPLFCSPTVPLVWFLRLFSARHIRSDGSTILI